MSTSLELSDVTYRGPAIDDVELFDRLPLGVQELLQLNNGFIQYGGGLHVRGACLTPEWHSLRQAWHGPQALHVLYSEVRTTDVPLAQNCLGDQFVVRDSLVWRLDGEQGHLENTQLDIGSFMRACQSDPMELLELAPLINYRHAEGALEPGDLVLAYPPLCTEEAGEETLSLEAWPASQVIQFHAKLAAHIARIGPGGSFRIEFAD